MSESFQVRGSNIDLSSLMKFLKEEGIPFRKVEEEKELDRLCRKEEDERQGFLREMPWMILAEVAKAIIVGLTTEALKALAKWLKERRKRVLGNPDLEVIVKGNILRLDDKDMKTLEKILKETTKNKKTRRKRKGMHYGARSSH